MKIIFLILISIFVLATSEPPKPLVFPSWPPKSNQLSQVYGSPALNLHSAASTKPKRTLVVQIRSENRVPFILKRSPHQQTALPSHNQPIIARRPIKYAITPHFMLKGNQLISKRKPLNMLKIKFGSNNGINSSAKLKDKPYTYEKPTAFVQTPELLKLPVKNAEQFSNNHFVPIHTVPAPNLASFDNHIHHDEFVFTPSSSISPHFSSHQYHVTEDHTNDQTIIDLVSGQHKYFAPDPDPSLPTAKIRPATEPFNTPSNGKPYPPDVQSNYLPPKVRKPSKQPLVQEFTDETVGPYPSEVYGLPVANQPQLQQFLLQQASTPISVYNPTYLVQQSKNLYSQHQLQKQLFKPNPITTYGTEDLTQEVASDGQILQSAKDHTNQIHPEFHGISSTIAPATIDIPSFAALVSPTQIRLKQEHNESPESGFVVSNYFGNAEQDPNYQEYVQLSQRQRENDRTLEQANLELQQKLLLEQDAPNIENSKVSVSAYEEHQRLLQQHLGAAPLRIFVPDDDYQNDLRGIQKRSDGNANKVQTPDELYDEELERENYDDDEDEEDEDESDYDQMENDKEIRIDRNNKNRN